MKTNEKTTDHTLVKECIFTALILLMEQQDYDKITITDITKKAGVSRMTYYRLYSSKEDILLQQFSKIIQELTDKIRQDSSLTPYRLVYQFFSFFQSGLFPLRGFIRFTFREQFFILLGQGNFFEDIRPVLPG